VSFFNGSVLLQSLGVLPDLALIISLGANVPIVE